MQNKEKKLLLIQPDPDLSQITSNVCRGLGYEVITADNEVGAWSKINATKDQLDAALVSLDIKPEDRVGLEIVRKLSLNSPPTMRIIMVLPHDSSSDDEACSKNAGAHEVIKRPIRIKGLCQVLDLI